MSPEQARGQTVDRRADIWAFGVVLYEMLTGRQLFSGPTISDTLASVLKGDLDLTAAPAQIRPVLERCLRRDPRLRWRSIADVLLLLEEEQVGQALPPANTARNAAIAAAAVLALALAIAGALLWRATRPVDHPLTRLSVDLGPDAMHGVNVTAAISPEGRRLVFPARGPDGRQMLATRLLDQDQAAIIPGTELGRDPLFSPDGQWIGFFSSNVLKRIPVQGGAPVVMGSGISVAGGTWRPDGSVVAAFGNTLPLSLVSQAGAARYITRFGPGEAAHRWPQVLPGGDIILFTASPSTVNLENAQIQAISLRTGAVKVLQRGGYYGRYLPTGHLIYLHQGILYGVRFDLARLETRGSPVPLLQDVAANPVTGGGQFDFSDTGTFVYAAGKSAAQTWTIDWLDSSGKTQRLMAAPGVYAQPRVSPDGRKLAFSDATGDVYVYDLGRDATTRLTFGGSANWPIWAPDGEHIVFSTGSGLVWVRADGAGEPQQLVTSDLVRPWSFAPDGRLGYFDRNPETGFDIWTLPLDLTDPDRPKPGKPEPFLRTAADELVPRFSPDGHWIAYRSSESGGTEIFVRPFPATGRGKWQISSGGGMYAFWSNNGRELFYETADNRIMVVDYAVNGVSFVPGKPRVWYDKQLFTAGTSNMDLAPDGRHFAVFALSEPAPGEKGSVHVTMLLNFFDELKRRIP
jgi:serine/threonine-protein kinase